MAKRGRKPKAEELPEELGNAATSPASFPSEGEQTPRQAAIPGMERKRVNKVRDAVIRVTFAEAGVTRARDELKSAKGALLIALRESGRGIQHAGVVAGVRVTGSLSNVLPAET